MTNPLPLRIAFAAVVLLTAVAVWRTRSGPSSPVLFDRRPHGVMGTSCLLAVLAPAAESQRARQALDAAEAELRTVEAHLSTYIEASAISKLNRVGAHEEVPLSSISLEVLRAAREAAVCTEGAFDTTCRPLLLLWNEAGRRNRLPSDVELEAARALVGWAHFELSTTGARKKHAQAQQDLGGLGKGYAVDRAVEAMRAAGVQSGLVQVGGDTRVFGPGPGGRDWEIQLRHPFREGTFGTIRLRDTAVCTSGNYQRYVEIEGRHYSHIVDPRTGRPMDSTPSVTVIAPCCMTADIWATAMSVLGPDGLEERCRRAVVHAMLVTGEPGRATVHQSEGFGSHLKEPVDLK